MCGLQLTKEEGRCKEAESRLHAALEQVEENQKKFDLTLQENSNEIRTLKEEVRVCAVWGGGEGVCCMGRR